MTEEEARSWIRNRFGVSRETSLDRFATLLLAEAQVQNLISAATKNHLWARHFVDSAQLLELSTAKGDWIDIGSGAGLPGLVLALLDESRRYVLVEPRARRVAFLRQCIDALQLGDRVAVEGCKIERFRPQTPAGTISARAVATLPELFRTAVHCADRKTEWLLPKGRSVQSEVEAARRAWQGSFHVEQSITDPESGIVVAREVRPR